MAKGIKVGVRARVSYPKMDTTDKGTWQFFSCNEVVKNQQTGNYDIVGRYTIWVNNPNRNIKHNDYVIIDRITKSTIEHNEVNGRSFYVNNLWCDCTLQAPYTPQFQPNQNQYNYQEQTQSQSQMPNFDVSADSLPFD